jgi:hypothetical protein
MNNSLNKESKYFKGSGYLLGLLVAIMGALTIFFLSGNFAAAIAGAIPIFVGFGIGMEQKFQEYNININPKKTRFMVWALFLGCMVFFALYLIARFN